METPHLAPFITRKLLLWYDAQARVFPFRGPKDPYRVWLSEIMLQQTRTETVGPYYERFLARFPDVFALAEAPEEQVLKAWEGLGYYARAHNLHRAARMVAGERGGVFPGDMEGLLGLPGVGPYAAAAIASIAYGEPVPALDGNLARVISRLFGVQEDIDRPETRRGLYALGLALMPGDRPGDMNQALMDLGATVCLPGSPDCARCPLREECVGFQSGNPGALPVRKPKPAPREVSVGVTVFTCAGRALLLKRDKALLKGLYVFPLAEGDDSPESGRALARSLGLAAGAPAFLAEARHAFTHRVWNMRVYRRETDAAPGVPGGVWADAAMLAALPLPRAMDAAKRGALALLRQTGTIRV